MGKLAEVLPKAQIYLGETANDKRAFFQLLAEKLHAAAPKVSTEVILHALQQRERLGTTAVGAGIAIPHGRLEGLDDGAAVFVRLDKAIDFDADEQHVDMAFAMLVPQNCAQVHLDMLAHIAEIALDESNVTALRTAENADQAYAIWA